MKILFIGGTGTISTSCLKICLEAGIDLTVLCRGTRNKRIPHGTHSIQGDAYQLDEDSERKLKDTSWDCIVNWTIYNAKQAELDIARFSQNTSRYFFISSTSVYDGSNQNNLITESQQYLETSWFYSKSKIEAEACFLKAYKEAQFPVTIIRPGHTYNDFTVPTNIQGLGFGLINRIKNQEPILIHDKGESRWTLTHSDDFAAAFLMLLSKNHCSGETYHITCEMNYTWNEIFSIFSDHLNRAINPIYVSSEEIYKQSVLLGEPIENDKKYNRIFDLSKLKKIIPEYKMNISLYDGIERVLRWHSKNSAWIKPNSVVENELKKIGM